MESRLDENDDRVRQHQEGDESNAALGCPSKLDRMWIESLGPSEVDPADCGDDSEDDQSPCIKVQSECWTAVPGIAGSDVQGDLAKRDDRSDDGSEYAHSISRRVGVKLDGSLSRGKQDRSRTKNGQQHRHALKDAQGTRKLTLSELDVVRAEQHAADGQDVEVACPVSE